MSQRKHKFKTEVRQLLDLVIHSLYSKKEIFLRELISNASDAIDRAQFEALTDKSLIDDDSDWRIGLRIDRDARTLTVSDNGIGMTADEVDANIGTIANSGTRRFLEALAAGGQSAKPDLIGQFGVGFYSSFMAADTVTVITRRAGPGHAAVKWVSEGGDSYTMEDAEKPSRGTDVILHLREDMAGFLETWRLREIVRRYSNYVSVPIVLSGTGVDAGKDETLNTMKAIWLRPKNEVTKDEYNEFYHHVSHDPADPLTVIHVAGEGATEFRSVLFVPSEAPFDLFLGTHRHGLHLYVRNVFITDDCKELLPDYLRFVRGVVDSSDLPLNVSREILQDDVAIRRIRKSLVGRILGALKEMSENSGDDFKRFHEAFGAVLKEGVNEPESKSDKLVDLLRFRSTASVDGAPVSLKEYAGRMKEGQKNIYYITADSASAAAASPHLEAFSAAGWEVLFMTDPVDEWVVMRLPEFDGKPLKPVNKGGDVELPRVASEGKTAGRDSSAKARELSDLLDFLRSRLQDSVQAVKVSSRLTDSAACLVAPEDAPDARLERLMRAMHREVPETKRILEVNPDHPLLRAMKARFDRDRKDPRLEEYAELLHGQAVITEGSQLKDPLRFTRLLASLMAEALGENAGARVAPSAGAE
jgi:molecular chaperone HtpG